MALVKQKEWKRDWYDLSKAYHAGAKNWQKILQSNKRDYDLNKDRKNLLWEIFIYSEYTELGLAGMLMLTRDTIREVSFGRVSYVYKQKKKDMREK